MGNDNSRHIEVNGYSCTVGTRLDLGDTKWGQNEGLAVFSLLPVEAPQGFLSSSKPPITISKLAAGGFALRRADKHAVLQDRSLLRQVMAEHRALSELGHEVPYVDHMFRAFQTEFELLLVTELLAGGSLRSYLNNERRFSAERSRYYAAQLVVALGLIHEAKFVHRDVKPDNLFLNHKGHCTLINFNHAVRLGSLGGSHLGSSSTSLTSSSSSLYGSSSSLTDSYGDLSSSSSNLLKKQHKDKNKSPNRSREDSPYIPSSRLEGGESQELSVKRRPPAPKLQKRSNSPAPGTSDFCSSSYPYFAPELVRKEVHDQAVDWWSLGVCLFEMLTGKVPFERDNSTYELNFEPFNEVLSSEAQSLLSGLLNPKASERLRSAEEIKAHPFFAGIDWSLVEKRKLAAPFLPACAPLVPDPQAFTQALRPEESAPISEANQLVFKHWDWDLTDFSSKKRKTLQSEDLWYLYQAFSDPTKGVHEQDRQSLFKTYPKCWVGSEAVDWILDNVSTYVDGISGLKRPEALSILNYWHRKHLVKGVREDQGFVEDTEAFYVFTAEHVTPGGPGTDSSGEDTPGAPPASR